MSNSADRFPAITRLPRGAHRVDDLLSPGDFACRRRPRAVHAGSADAVRWDPRHGRFVGAGLSPRRPWLGWLAVAVLGAAEVLAIIGQLLPGWAHA